MEHQTELLASIKSMGAAGVEHIRRTGILPEEPDPVAARLAAQAEAAKLEQEAQAIAQRALDRITTVIAISDGQAKIILNEIAGQAEGDAVAYKRTVSFGENALVEEGIKRAARAGFGPHGSAFPTEDPPPKAKPKKAKGKRTRKERAHSWPELGRHLQGTLNGTVYEAVIVPRKRCKSGKGIKVLNGPAAGQEFASYSGAMEAATAEQRSQQNLGRKGMSSGWKFWKAAP